MNAAMGRQITSRFEREGRIALAPVLVVDSDPELLASYERLLQRFGCRVFSARSRREALRYLSCERVRGRSNSLCGQANRTPRVRGAAGGLAAGLRGGPEVNSRDPGCVGRAAHHDAVPAPAAPFLCEGCEPGLAGAGRDAGPGIGR